MNDSIIIDVVVPTSEVSVSSSNKRNTTNNISTVTSRSSQVNSPPVNTNIVTINQTLQFVLTVRFYRYTRWQKQIDFVFKSKVISND